MATKYKLSRSNLAKCLNRLKDASDEKVKTDDEFMYYHKNRNFFNIRYHSNEHDTNTFKTLEQIDKKTFRDDFDRKWIEETVGIIYHRPFDTVGEKYNYARDLFRKRSERFCRKFVSVDEHIEKAGYDGVCEFELIIHERKRMIGGPFMETYNFGGSATLGLLRSIHSTKLGLHGKYDVEPHFANNQYVTRHYHTHAVQIIDL